MSDYERHSGKLVRVLPGNGESFEDLLKRTAKEVLKVELEDLDEIEEELYYNKKDTHIVLLKEKALFKMVNHMKSNSVDDYMSITPIEEGFSFDTQFYNSGTCLKEMLNDELQKQLKQ
jgi:hypothetical protein